MLRFWLFPQLSLSTTGLIMSHSGQWLHFSLSVNWLCGTCCQVLVSSCLVRFWHRSHVSYRRERALSVAVSSAAGVGRTFIPADDQLETRVITFPGTGWAIKNLTKKIIAGSIMQLVTRCEHLSQGVFWCIVSHFFFLTCVTSTFYFQTFLVEIAVSFIIYTASLEEKFISGPTKGWFDVKWTTRLTFSDKATLCLVL